MLPKLEYRVEALEQRTSKAEASIIQLSDTSLTKTIDDVTEEIHKSTAPIERRLDTMDSKLNQIEETQQEILALLKQNRS